MRERYRLRYEEAVHIVTAARKKNPETVVVYQYFDSLEEASNQKNLLETYGQENYPVVNQPVLVKV